MQIKNCAQAITQNIVMVPEDRKKHGIVPIMSVGKNITLVALPKVLFSVKVINEPLEETIINQSIAKLTKVKPLPLNFLSDV